MFVTRSHPLQFLSGSHYCIHRNGQRKKEGKKEREREGEKKKTMLFSAAQHRGETRDAKYIERKRNNAIISIKAQNAIDTFPTG